MKYGICKNSIIPVRITPSEKVEMVTQLLFGDCYTVLDENQNWLLIKLNYDNYEGWINRKQFDSLSESDFTRIIENDQFVSTSMIGELTCANQKKMWLTFGSTLPLYKGGKLYIGKEQYEFNGNIADTRLPSPKQIGHFAIQLLQAPYLWGGRSMLGIDCSGFTQIVYKAAGIRLNRDASQQASQGKTIDFIEEIEAGDLAFFDNDEGQITHVGIILDASKIIHASGQVRIDNIDHQGIFNVELQQYTHKLRLLKRVLNP